MKNLTWLLLLITLSSCSAKVSVTPNPTASWIPIGESKEGDIISMDTGTLSYPEGQSRAWVRIDYKKTPSLKQNATQFYASFNCQDRTVKTIRQVDLGTMGETIKDQSIKMSPKRVIPLSTEGIAFQKICWAKNTSNIFNSKDNSN
ncbi:MAG: surface-adhesin E family protein [Coleofasciculaceae cyanobacterium]